MKPLKTAFLLTLIFVMSLMCAACSSGSKGGGYTDEGGPSPNEVDRSILPDTPPQFSSSPYQFPNGIEKDLDKFGIYNQTSNCDGVHIGWDFTPNWSSYPDNLVPVVAVADGVISNISLHNTNTYNEQGVTTYGVVLSVAKEVDVYYTFEPFVVLGDTEASKWLTVTVGEKVSAGRVIGYLPKLDGNTGEDLIHIDFKVGTGSNRNNFVCPEGYFSSQWRQDNGQSLISKAGKCQALCYE